MPRRKRPRAKASPPAVLESRRAKKRKKWPNESMLAALEAVKNGCPVKRAAMEHNVPRTTLQDRHLGKVTHGTKPGPKTYLTVNEETELGEFVQVVGELGYGKTRTQVKNIAESVAREKGVLRCKRISDGWFRRFLERQPKLCLRKGDSTAGVHMDAMSDQDALDSYFKLLNEVMEKHNLMDKPGQIYNVDESGMPFDHRPPRVLAQKGQKKVRYRTSGNKSQVTVIGCVSAAGQAIPPFVIFDAKSLNIEWTKGEVAGARYGLSDSGWVDMDLFKSWFCEQFLMYAVGSRPLLLLLDGHSSHYNPQAVRLAKENDVILFTLVPHTTHEMQPLDTAVFGPLKIHWRDACHDFMQANPGKVISKYTFSTLLNTAWMKAMVPKNIINGFRTSGVYPFNPKAVLDHDPCVTPSSSDQLSDTDPVQSTSTESSRELEPTKCPEYTQADEELFQRRYEEGYDMYDPMYAAWMKNIHPAEVPLQLSENPSDDNPVLSVTDFFSNVSPIENLAIPWDPSPDVTPPPSAVPVLSPSHNSTLAPSVTHPPDGSTSAPSATPSATPHPSDGSTSAPSATSHPPDATTSAPSAAPHPRDGSTSAPSAAPHPYDGSISAPLDTPSKAPSTTQCHHSFTSSTNPSPPPQGSSVASPAPNCIGKLAS